MKIQLPFWWFFFFLNERGRLTEKVTRHFVVTMNKFLFALTEQLYKIKSKLIDSLLIILNGVL
ncbi:hypothetical protein [Neobacillus sp. PS3-40]|uniref:hypothetical protein n=1 Tax=Neobacillus sp. PS3-40 TaxID=3070679 RepID=UPI0027DF6BBA|nr:hypothetical protein [Neobacillus sp. PS3-40]WML43236.1 hypothetical protein RCG20_15740 [Neobacillus sp. PS3-40]